MKINARFVIMVLVVLLISVSILATSFRLLPDAPLYPTPTPPKGIELPDSRPVPGRR